MEFLEACKSSFGTFVFRLVKWFESINYKHLIVCSACWDQSSQFLDLCLELLGKELYICVVCKRVYIHTPEHTPEHVK